MSKIPNHVDVAPDIPEIVAAAKWWADQLRGPVVQDNGDAFQSGFATFASLACRVLSPVVLLNFERELRERIAERFNSWKCWCPENPNWASANRVLHVDYHPGGVLADAAIAAGVTSPSLRFPIKTNMWVNPGCVEVSAGYRAESKVIYGTKPQEPA